MDPGPLTRSSGAWSLPHHEEARVTQGVAAAGSTTQPEHVGNGLCDFSHEARNRGRPPDSGRGQEASRGSACALLGPSFRVLGSRTARAHSQSWSRSVSTGRSARTSAPRGPPVRGPEAILTGHTGHPEPRMALGLGTTVLPRLQGTLEMDETPSHTDETPSLPCADLTSRPHRPCRRSLVILSIQPLSQVREPRGQCEEAERRSLTQLRKFSAVRFS